jgi:hypothetical protein
MTPASLLDDIVAAASEMTPTGTIRGYVFGSILKPDFRWTDVDILIVCDDALDVPGVRPALALICNGAPVDLLVMSAAEEGELDFVSGQGCQPLFELSV